MNPIEQLKKQISGMTEAQKKVADYIIKNSFDVAFATVDQLANSVGTSTTTIMRLMTFLGYSGYTEFQKGLREMLRNKVTPKERLEVNLRDIRDGDLWTQCCDKQLQNIHDTFAGLASETLDQVVREITLARKVYIVAARGGAMVAQYMFLFFSRMRPNVYLIDSDSVAAWSTIVPDANAQDLLIAISYPRYAKTLLQCVSVMKQRGVFVIGITDGYSSPLAEYSNLLLPCVCGSLGFHNSPVSAMLLADCIINVISLQYSSEVKDKLALSSEILSKINYYYDE